VNDRQEITVNEWLAELAAFSVHDDEGRTAVELAEEAGVSVETLLKRLHKANDLGRLVVGKRRRKTLDGRVSHVPVYRVLPAPKKAKR